MKLVISADDFGLSRGINQGILAGTEAGAISNVSVIAGGAACHPDDIARLRDAPASVAVHLTLDRIGTPGLERRSQRAVYLELLRGRVPLAALESAWRAQIERCLDMGLRVTNLNGHGHVHVLPGLAGVTLKLAREFGLRYVRVPSEPLFYTGSRRSAPRYLRKLLLYLLSTQARQRFSDLEPACFVGATDVGRFDLVAFERLGRYFAARPRPMIEVMTHPGYLDEDMQEFSRNWAFRYHWEDEATALAHPGLQSRLAELGFRIVPIAPK